MRNKQELVKRYLFFAIGLFINAMGVALIIVAALGTSPIAVIPDVMHQATGYSVGTFTFLLNMILLLLQIIILGRQFQIYQFLQIPVSLAFGYFVDLSLNLFGFLESSHYGIQLCVLVAGCVVRALGVSIQVLADVVMLSGEAIVKAVSVRFEKEFSRVKLCADGIMVIVAMILSYAFMHEIVAVREGSFLAVVLIAPCSTFFTRKLYFMEHYLSSGKALRPDLPKRALSVPKDTASLVITISSDYGSGGHKIGKIIAESLGFRLYDRNLAELVSKECGATIEYTEAHDEKLYRNLYEEFITEAFSVPGSHMDPYAELFEAQKKVISGLTHENCVIIGHCSNYILKDYPNAIHIHIHSDMEHRLNRLIRDYKIDQKTAQHLISRRDHAMSAYYRHFTGENWKDFDHYTITMENALLETKETAELLLNIIRRINEKRSAQAEG